MTQRRITINNSRSLRHYPCHQNKHNSHSFIVWYYQLQHQQHDFRLRVNRRNQKDNKKKTLETHGIFQLHSSNCPISDWNRIYCTSPFVRQTQSTSTCCWVSFYQTNSCLSTHRMIIHFARPHTHTRCRCMLPKHCLHSLPSVILFLLFSIVNDEVQDPPYDWTN